MPVFNKNKHMTFYAEKCYITGKGINEGWEAHSGNPRYIGNWEDAERYCMDWRYMTLEEAKDDFFIGWVSLEEDPPKYVEIDGILYAIDEVELPYIPENCIEKKSWA